MNTLYLIVNWTLTPQIVVVSLALISGLETKMEKLPPFRFLRLSGLDFGAWNWKGKENQGREMRKPNCSFDETKEWEASDVSETVFERRPISLLVKNRDFIGRV